MHLFIDTNILLGFYHLTDDDIEELRKLIVLAKAGDVVLWTTSQLVDEFWRNRDAKIKDALKEFYAPSWRSKVPAFVKDYGEYKQTNDALKLASAAFDALKSKVDQDIASETLAADKLIADIFKVAQCVEVTQAIFGKAIERMRAGRKPGKGGNSIGDEINWECLLLKISEGESLHIVSQDGDYASPLHKDTIHHSLKREWKAQKKADAFLYTRLSSFFGSHFKDIKVASEIERREAIKRLAQSTSFATTHNAISALSKYTDFAPWEVEDLLAAAITNSQIQMIIADKDVDTFFKDLIAKFGDKVDPAAVEMFDEVTAIWR